MGLQESSLVSRGLRIENGELLVLDQSALPFYEQWIRCHNPQIMIELIQSLKIRGAPAIGVGAVLSLGLFIEKELPSFEEILQTAKALYDSRPTAVNLMNALDRMVFKNKNFLNSHDPSDLPQIAVDIFKEDQQLCESIAKHGSQLIEYNENILTICNTGGIATAGIGTALGIIEYAHKQKKYPHVYVCETRPLLQGARLTCWELKKLGIAFTLITDSMAATLMQQNKVHKVFAGADRIAANGDSANKIGTYNLAVLAHHHKLPFYIAAPTTTCDPHCPNGKSIPVEERSPEEIRGVRFFGKEFTWAKDDYEAYNPAFDVTPNELITSHIFESGLKKF